MTDETEAGRAGKMDWNGAAARNWVEAQGIMDRLLKPFEEALVEAVWRESPRRVLDIGCGAGATTLAIARALGERGECVGVDISAAMVAAARARAERAGLPLRFVEADAETHGFEPGAADMIVSRFGVMFFDDAVRAFANLRRAALPGAAIRFIAWRDPSENPLMTAAAQAAAPLLPDLPQRKPGASGPFALADGERTQRLLAESGWEAIEIRPIDVPCALPAADLEPYVTRLGPVGEVFGSLPAPMQERVRAAILPAFAPFRAGEEIRFTAACWMAAARAPAA